MRSNLLPSLIWPLRQTYCVCQKRFVPRYSFAIGLLQFNLFGPGGEDPTQINAQTIYQLLIRVIQIALGLIGAIAVIYIIVAGIQYIMAGGDASKQAEAKRTIQAAVIGLIIAMSASLLVGYLLRTFQFSDTIRQNREIQRIIE